MNGRLRQWGRPQRAMYDEWERRQGRRRATHSVANAGNPSQGQDQSVNPIQSHGPSGIFGSTEDPVEDTGCFRTRGRRIAGLIVQVVATLEVEREGLVFFVEPNESSPVLKNRAEDLHGTLRANVLGEARQG
ncbi:hypothetical protein KM043_008529 [Ampulex compressa]|nr:hypothetical protein KM043_008529 [Ampulex compressa]